MPNLNLPNVLSLVRILLVPIIVVVLLTEVEDKEFIGLALFLIVQDGGVYYHCRTMGFSYE